MKTRKLLILNSLIKNDRWNTFFLQNPCVPPCISDSDKNTSDAHNKRGLGEKETSLLQKIREKKAKERRYMKSSCQWTTIHFHFEVLRTIVKCDCMWQSPSLPVYHDGYTLPPWWCCSTHVRTCAHSCTHTHALVHWTQTHTSGLM